MKKFITKKEAAEFLNDLGEEFSIIQNPSYIHPNYEVVPLAPKLNKPTKKIVAVVMDMDGTTTTTEEICIHSLEYMVRKITGRMNKSDWTGLDHRKDYPHIIGNSTTKHVEYLIRTYKNEIKITELIKSLIFAALWTLLIGKDESRKEEVRNNLQGLGCSVLLKDDKYVHLKKSKIKLFEFLQISNYFIKKYASKLDLGSTNKMIRAGIDIYYQRYHEILLEITKGKSSKLSQELLGNKNKHLIEPLPGVGIFLALTKGLLGNEAGKLSSLIIHHYRLKNLKAKDKFKKLEVERILQKLSRYFTANPIKVGVVTSSIYYEANIVMSEVFRILKDEVKTWDISSYRKQQILEKFKSYQVYYDGIVTASDSNEVRLKPHRDLYSIALHKLAVSKNDFDKVIGFEDSESGTIAIRAAGIGRAVAVPFSKTEGHNLAAASYIAKGGLPEIILRKNIYLNL